MENKEKVLQILKDSKEALKTGEIVDKSGLDKKEVDRWIKLLKDEDLIDSPKRCFYQAK